VVLRDIWSEGGAVAVCSVGRAVPLRGIEYLARIQILRCFGKAYQEQVLAKLLESAVGAISSFVDSFVQLAGGGVSAEWDIMEIVSFFLANFGVFLRAGFCGILWLEPPDHLAFEKTRWDLQVLSHAVFRWKIVAYCVWGLFASSGLSTHFSVRSFSFHCSSEPCNAAAGGAVHSRFCNLQAGYEFFLRDCSVLWMGWPQAELNTPRVKH